MLLTLDLDWGMITCTCPKSLSDIRYTLVQCIMTLYSVHNNQCLQLECLTCASTSFVTFLIYCSKHVWYDRKWWRTMTSLMIVLLNYCLIKLFFYLRLWFSLVGKNVFNINNVWDSGKPFMTNCSYEHAEWITPGNFLEAEFWFTP